MQFVDNVRNYYDILERMQPRDTPIAAAAPDAPLRSPRRTPPPGR